MSVHQSLIVLFADISQSTQLYEELGNAQAQELIFHCLSLLKGVAEAHDGKVIKEIGDEILCVFTDTSKAARAAGEMHGGVRKSIKSDHLPFGRLRLRIGMHHGPVFVEGHEVYGETVHIASRMAKLAKPDQIITTEPTVWKMSEDLQAMTRYVDEQTIVGKLGKLELYEIIWEVTDLTDLATHQPPRELRTTHSHLHLRCGEQRFSLGEDVATLTIGRSETCQLVVPSLLASRQHAEIAYSRGRFIFRDQSINGSFIVREDGREVSLLRDDYPLSSTGRIGIGEPPGDNAEIVISYACK